MANSNKKPDKSKDLGLTGHLAEWATDAIKSATGLVGKASRALGGRGAQIDSAVEQATNPKPKKKTGQY